MVPPAIVRETESEVMEKVIAEVDETPFAEPETTPTEDAATPSEAETPLDGPDSPTTGGAA